VLQEEVSVSEYQYYEFQAIDRPLTRAEMDELRRFSSRARITPTSFVVDYSWGSFKGDEDAWMQKYFDAFLYLANWGTRVVKLRLPAGAVDPRLAEEYAWDDGLRLEDAGGRLVLTITSKDEDPGDWVEGEGWLASLLPVRAELALGDLRPLYVGWLLGVQRGEVDDDALEPPVPPGLRESSASLVGLIDFLGVDLDLLAASAQASPPTRTASVGEPDVRAFLATLSVEEKDAWLAQMVRGEGNAAAVELQRLFREHQARARPNLAGSPRRTVAELLAAASRLAAERHHREARALALAQERAKKEAAEARERHLNGLLGQESKLWATARELVATNQPRKQEQAVSILVDLRDLDARRPGSGDFEINLTALRAVHGRKKAFLEKLRKAGL
jgi:hypothetical protein